MGHKVRKDPVTPGLRDSVFARDTTTVSELMADFGLVTVWRNERLFALEARRDTVVCPAVVIDSTLLGTCSGRWTLDHIKRFPRLGRRAESTMGTLISLCEGHTESGMKAGYQWNTSHRREIRKYLEDTA